MRVRIPSPLRSYTGQQTFVQANGETLDQVLVDLDRRFSGIRFRVVDEQDRVRPHMLVFVDGVRTTDLQHVVTAEGEVVLVPALSGG